VQDADRFHLALSTPPADSPHQSQDSRKPHNHLLGQRMKTTIQMAALLMMLCGTVGCSPATLSDRDRQGLTAGQQILTAIYQYHADHGQYPASLDTLVPDYYPTPIDGGKRRSMWSYRPPQTNDIEMITLSWGRGRQSRLIYMDTGQKRGWSKMFEGGRSVAVTAPDVRSAVEKERQSQPESGHVRK
jgi:hypothetical protein